MSASQTLEHYLASFKRKPKPRHAYRPSLPVAKPRVQKFLPEPDTVSVSTVSSIDTEMLLRSDTSEVVAREAQKMRERGRTKHKKNVHSMPLSIIQENGESAARAYCPYDIYDYLPQSSAYQHRQLQYPRCPPQRNKVQRQEHFTARKQSTVSSVDTDALLQSSSDEAEAENFPISHLTRELLEKRHAYRPESRESISPRYNPVMSIGNTSRASPIPQHGKRDADIQMPLISPSPDLTSHVRTMSVPLSPSRGRKLSETTTVMVENNRQVLLCPSQRSEEKASLESTLQKCLGAHPTCFQEPRPSLGPVSITPKFSNKPNLQIKHPFDPSSSSRKGDSPARPSTSSDPSEAFEVFYREQLPQVEVPESSDKSHRTRRKCAKTYIKLKVCTCILAGMINSHKPGCKVTTVTALLPTGDSNNSSFGSLCNLKSGTTHSHLHSTGSRAESSLIEEQKGRKKMSILDAVILIQFAVRKFLKRRKESLSMVYSRSTNDRSAAPSDIERATRSIYSALDHLQELKSQPSPSAPTHESGRDLLLLEELCVSAPHSEANSDLLDLSSEQFGRVIRPNELHAAAQSSWSEFLQRESGETLWIDASTNSIEGLGSKDLSYP